MEGLMASSLLPERTWYDESAPVLHIGPSMADALSAPPKASVKRRLPLGSKSNACCIGRVSSVSITVSYRLLES